MGVSNGQTCTPGSNLMPKKPSVTCGANGNWATAVPYCASVTCPSLQLPEGGKFEGARTPGKAGQQCTVSCAFGLMMSTGNGL